MAATWTAKRAEVSAWQREHMALEQAAETNRHRGRGRPDSRSLFRVDDICHASKMIFRTGVTLDVDSVL